jgi:hypothetical protein
LIDSSGLGAGAEPHPHSTNPINGNQNAICNLALILRPY